jgi:ABC-2 type transport system permease protein
MIARPRHLASALAAVTTREVVKFVHQRGRLLSALVRPLLWLVVFGAGFQNVFGASIMPPYRSYIRYQEYIVPGLLGIVLLFHEMQSALGMVYDREMGLMRLLLTAPLPRWYLLLCKLVAGTALSLIQAYAFLALGLLFDTGIPLSGWLYGLPALAASGLMLGALGLLLSVHIRQLENFAGTMNFVIFPMFFISTALYPLSKFSDNDALAVWWLAQVNPFTYAVELIRFALYGRFQPLAALAVVAFGVAFFLFAVLGYDPQRGLIRRAARGA